MNGCFYSKKIQNYSINKPEDVTSERTHRTSIKIAFMNFNFVRQHQPLKAFKIILSSRRDV